MNATLRKRAEVVNRHLYPCNVPGEHPEQGYILDTCYDTTGELVKRCYREKSKPDEYYYKYITTEEGNCYKWLGSPPCIDFIKVSRSFGRLLDAVFAADPDGEL